MAGEGSWNWDSHDWDSWTWGPSEWSEGSTGKGKGKGQSKGKGKGKDYHSEPYPETYHYPEDWREEPTNSRERRLVSRDLARLLTEVPASSSNTPAVESLATLLVRALATQAAPETPGPAATPAPTPPVAVPVAPPAAPNLGVVAPAPGAPPPGVAPGATPPALGVGGDGGPPPAAVPAPVPVVLVPAAAVPVKPRVPVVPPGLQGPDLDKLKKACKNYYMLVCQQIISPNCVAHLTHFELQSVRRRRRQRTSCGSQRRRTRNC